MGDPICIFCEKPILRVERGLSFTGGHCWVVVCPCDEWEVPGAKSKEQALQWFEFGDKSEPVEDRQEALF